MSNNFNILPEKFGKSSKNFFNDDPVLWIRLFDWKNFMPFGYTDIAKSFKQSKEYDELKVGKPASLVHKTPKEINRSFEAKLWQYQKETIALCTGGYIDNSDPQFPRVVYGSFDLGTLECSMILKGKNVSGKRVELYIRKGLITSDDIETAIGDSYSSLDFKLDVVEDEDPLITNFNWPMMNTFTFTADTEAGSEILTNVSNSTPILKDMLIYTADGFKSTVTDKNATEIMLNEAPSVDASGVLFKAVAYENVSKDNIAFWLLEE